MIEFSKENFFYCCWFVYPPSTEWMAAYPAVGLADWAAWLYKNAAGKLVVATRFHYYDEPDRAGGRRNWNCRESVEPFMGNLEDLQEQIEFLTKMAGMSACRYNSSVDYIELCCDGEAAAKKLLEEADWFHLAKKDDSVEQ